MIDTRAFGEILDVINSLHLKCAGGKEVLCLIGTSTALQNQHKTGCCFSHQNIRTRWELSSGAVSSPMT
jgi:hypothetical protein